MAFADDTFKITGNAAAGTGGGVVGLIVLVLDVLVFGMSTSKVAFSPSQTSSANDIVIVEVFQSSRPPGNKLLWALLVFFFPIVGV